MWTGVWQDPPGKPAKLLPFNILWLCRMLAKRLFMILVMSLRTVSKRQIGRVFFKEQFQSVGLGIGYMVASFH